MREIARRADVNVATAYHHFGSKRGLFLAIFREHGFLDAQWPDLQIEGTAEEKLQVLFLGAWTFMSSGSEVIRLAIQEALKGDAEVRSVFDDWRDQGEARLRDDLRKMGLARKSNVTGRARVVRQVIWGTFVEHLMQGLEFEELQQRGREAAHALLRDWS